MRKTNAHILVLDDNLEILIAAKLVLKRCFSEVNTLSDPRKALTFLAENHVDVVLLDMNFRLGFEDGSEGIYWLKEFKKKFVNTAVILMSSYGHIPTAVKGIQLGALDYLLKPWDNEQLISTVNKALQQKPQEQKPEPTSVFIGKSPLIKRAYTLANKVAPTLANVLILGENGTGKYVLAQHMHQHSTRKEGPFVHVDLGALNENLFESELFGYAKGAFTDAKQDTAGRFETANNGTIFLDEIANIPLHLQSKLLQVIQSKKVTRLGESIAREIDIRIISATNADLTALIEQKQFREDLFYRINTVSIELPTLHESQQDIPQLLAYFIDKYAKKYSMEAPTITKELEQQLAQYPWPGNIREMQNKVERALIMAENQVLTLEDFDLSPISLVPNYTEQNNLEQLERETIIKALHNNQGNISKTASELGLSRASLYRRMSKHNINQ